MNVIRLHLYYNIIKNGGSPKRNRDILASAKKMIEFDGLKSTSAILF